MTSSWYGHWVNTILSVTTSTCFLLAEIPSVWELIKNGLCHNISADNIASVTKRQLPRVPDVPEVTRLHRSSAHAQMVAAAPPPSSRVLQPGARRLTSADGPHSLVTTSRSWHRYDVMREIRHSLLTKYYIALMCHVYTWCYEWHLTWNTPLVLTQAEEVGGHSTDQAEEGLKPSQRRAWHQSISINTMRCERVILWCQKVVF